MKPNHQIGKRVKTLSQLYLYSSCRFSVILFDLCRVVEIFHFIMTSYQSSAGVKPRTTVLYKVFHILTNCIRVTCICFSPCIVSLFTSKQPGYRIVQSGLWFILGLVVSAVIYQLFLIDMGLDVAKTYTIALVMTCSVSVGMVVSRQIRAITLLTLSNFLGKSGQSALKALMLSFVVAGPIQNLADNGQEVVRVFSCTTALTYNMTKTRYELMFKPFSDALFGMRADAGDLKESLNSARGVVEPIRRELLEEGEAKYLKETNDYLEELDRLRQQTPEASPQDLISYETPEQVELRYTQKLEYRCEGMINRASSKCKNTFTKLYDSCWDKLHWSVNWALCWPMKLTFICNFASTFGDACQPGKHVPPGYGRGFVSLNQTQNQMKEQFKEVRMQYKVSKYLKVPQGIQDTFDSSSELMAQFTEKKNFVDFVLWVVVKWVLAFSFIRVLWKAEEYQRLYLTDIEFDNVYITDYFRKIDTRRRKQFKQTVLPLKKLEKAKFVDPYSFSIQWSTVATPIIKLFLEIVPATFFIFVDRLFYETLDLIRRHSHIEYTQVGHHDLQFKVKGTGMIASLVRSVIKGFNVKKRIKVEHSNLLCLPQPTSVPVTSIYKIYATFLCVFLMVIFNGYLRRLRRVCCALFFRRHEKRRVLYLYNETLRQRRAFFKFKKSRVTQLVKENRLTEDSNILLILRLRFPRYFRWLVMFPVARRKCLICKEPEKKTWPKIACPDCPYVFCEECWDMIEHSCYLCYPSVEGNGDQSDDGFEWNKSE